MAARRSLAIIGGLVGFGLGGYAMFGPDIEVVVSEDLARQKFQASLPIAYSGDHAEALVRAATIDLQGGNRLRVTADVNISGYGFSGVASGEARSAFRYEGGNFYLVGVSLDQADFMMDDVSSPRAPGVRSAAKGIWGMMGEPGPEAAPDAPGATDLVTGDAVGGINGKARNVLEDALRTTPVYSMKGKGLTEAFAALAVKDVSFTADAAILTLDPGKAILRILAFLALGGALLLSVIFMTKWLLSSKR